MQTEAYDPKGFYQVFVKRAYEEYLAASEDQFRAKIAITQADTMAERLWAHWIATGDANGRRFPSARRFREFLVTNECKDFQFVWDIHDGHKHFELHRPNRAVSSAAQTGYHEADATIGGAAVGEVAIGGSRRDLIVIADDGQLHDLRSILANVIAMWERLLSAI